MSIFRHKPTRPSLALAAALVVSGCGVFDDETLEGDRVRIRLTEQETARGDAQPLGPAAPLASWTQTNGSASHNSGHIAGPQTLAVAWEEDAGQGNGDEGWITSPPIVVGPSVLTLDAASEVRAFDATTGALNWSLDLAPEGEDGEDGFGGGLAAEGETVFAATGFGEVIAIASASGEILWRRSFPAPFRSGPGVANGIVVAVARDDQAYALRAGDGELLWRDQGVAAETAILGGATAAIAGNLVVLPYSSGEMTGLDIGTGRAVWSAVLGGGRRGLARSSITDITGDPVIAGPLVVAANQSGRLIAVDGRSGQRAWTRSIGSTKPIWPVGDTLFVMSDLAKLHRLDLRDGTAFWVSALPAFEDEEDREDPISYSGPIAVGGNILVTDNLRNLWAFDPVTGEGDVMLRLPGGSRTGPVAAGGTVFVLTDDADLVALR